MAVARVIAPLNVAFPGQNAPLTSQPTSQPQSPWWQFWRDLWQRTGGNTGVDSALLQSDLSNVTALVGLPARPTPKPPLPFGITVTASPFSYQAPLSGHVLINGGTVSAAAVSRDGSTFFACPTAGVVPVIRGDIVKVTYSGLPTMTMDPS